jgi:hypothetical protein
MRPCTAPGRGWSLLALALASAVLGALFGVLNHFQPAGSVAFWFNLVTPLAFSVPGAVLVGYRPANPSGWILCTMGLTSGVALFLAEYGQYTIRTNPGSVPACLRCGWRTSSGSRHLGWCRYCSCSFRMGQCRRGVGDRLRGSPWRPWRWSSWLVPSAPARSVATRSPVLRTIRWGSGRPARSWSSPEPLPSW